MYNELFFTEDKKVPEPSKVTPITLKIKVEKVVSVSVCGCMEYSFFINGQEYKKLPLDANVREPDTKKSKPYKDMIRTLEEHPEDFFENNLGISVIASEVIQIANNEYEMRFEHGTGILNGGHTQQALLDAQKNFDVSKATVKMTVRQKDYSKRRIAEIAAAQNSCTAVKEYSLAEKRGLFQDLKAKMEPSIEGHIIWWEGKEVSANKGLEPVDLIAILNVFNIKLNSSKYSNSTSQPTQSATGKATVFKKWETETNVDSYKMIYPLVNDILKLYEYLQKHFADGTGMSALSIIKDTKGKGKELIFSTDVCEYTIPKQMLFPLLAAYRSDVYYDENNNKIGWFEDPYILFEKYNKEMCAKLRTAFKSAGNDVNRVGKDPTIWENLFLTMRSHIDETKVYKKYDI